MKITKLLIIVLCVFLLGCESIDNHNDNNIDNEELIEYDISKDDISISNITTNSFNYHFDYNDNINIESISLYKDGVFVKDVDSEDVAGLDDDSTYELVIKYSYDSKGEKKLKETHLSIKTIPEPAFVITPYNDKVIFAFSLPKSFVNVVVNDVVYDITDYFIEINELAPDTLYSYSIKFLYEENEYTIVGSFKTLEKEEFEVNFRDGISNEQVTVIYKKGEKIEVPDLKIVHYGYRKINSKYLLVFKGFDVDLDSITDDTRVKVVYERIPDEEIHGFSDMLLWMNDVTSSDIEKIKVVYYQEHYFGKDDVREKEYNKEDSFSIINEIYSRIQNEKIDEILEEDVYTGDAIPRIILYFYVNGFDYILSIPIGVPLLDGQRMVSNSLTKYLKSLVPPEE